MTDAPGPLYPPCHPTRTWFKSSFSGNDDCCVEVNIAPDHVLVRDSKFQRGGSNDSTQQPILEYTTDEWRAFVAGVKAGEFDL